MKDKWILEWHITRYGTSDEYDSFEEAKTAFRNKIAREIDIDNYLDHMEDELEESQDGEKIYNFLSKFFENTLESSDIINAEFSGDFDASFNEEGFSMQENESYGQQTYPTIESNFVMMDDPEKQYHFYFNDPYNPNGIDYMFDGYDYEMTLRKKTKEDYMVWVETEENGEKVWVQKLSDDYVD